MSHRTTFDVLHALPPAQKRFWGIQGGTRRDLEAIVQRGNPDIFCGAIGEARAQQAPFFVTYRYSGDRQDPRGLNAQGRLFHYMPIDTDVKEGSGAWQSDSTGKWRFVMRGFRHYFQLILGWLAAGRSSAALSATCVLFHFLQDQTAFFHSLESEEGASPWILDELIQIPAGASYSASMLLGEATPKIRFTQYHPELLGESAEEACFHLYQRYREVKHRNRMNLVPMVQAHCRGDLAAEQTIRGRIGRATGELTYDLIYTLKCLATSHFTARRLRALRSVALGDLKPVNYPRHAAPPYGFTPLIRNAALGPDRSRQPLRLKIKIGRRWVETTFFEGLAIGAHKESLVSYPVPRGVFRRLAGYAGLHSRLNGPGALELTIYLNQRQKFRAELNQKHPSVKFDLDMTPGGLLTFRIRQAGSYSFFRSPTEHLMLGQPCFFKS